jgi:putative Holliday junction resolvase
VGRLMCLDIGDKRIGVAVSDPMGITAQGIETWTRRSIREDAEHFKALADQLDVEKLVVGLPRNMDGSFGFQSKKVRNYAGKIGEMLGVPVVFFFF